MIKELVKQLSALQRQVDGLIKPEVTKNNYGAAVAPTVNEDSGDGYSVGSVWIDTVADDAYICLDSTVAAAVWKKTTP